MQFLIIDDDKTFRDAACILVEDGGHVAEGACSGAAGLARLQEAPFDAVLLDLSLGSENGLDILTQIRAQQPQVPVVMITAQGSIPLAVEAMRRGAVDFLEKPIHQQRFVAVSARLQQIRQLGQRVEKLESEAMETRRENVEPIFDFSTLAMGEVMDIMRRAASTPASVLILGESGTGKSVAARAVHMMSHLREKPFVTVSCPSLSKDLLESELFGHVKGSFTGAVRDCWGKVRSAEGGTLFLDEIGDLPLEVQPKLLRLLQEREYERLGENVTRRADVRFIAATNRDLRQRVAAGSFREDLYFRLNVITVVMPPLREREGDLLRFAEHYQRHFAGLCGRSLSGFSEAAVARLRAYGWPGNLRELRNAIERAVILAPGALIEACDLPSDLPGTPSGLNSTAGNSAMLAAGDKVSLAVLEEAHIRQVLLQSPSLTAAADLLGIDQATLYRKRKKLGLE